MVSSGSHSEFGNGISFPASKYKCGKDYVIRDFPPGCGRLAAPTEQAMRQNVSASEIAVFHRKRVSAIRDFPPFCRRNAPPRIIGKTICTNVKLSVEEISPTPVEPASEKTRKQGTYGASSSRNVLAGGSYIRKKISPSEWDHQRLIRLFSSRTPFYRNIPDKYKCGKDYVIRDFPPGCGRLAEPTEPTKLNEISSSQNVTASEIAVFHRKRVSAIRDFPPFCGRNAPPPNKEFSVVQGKGWHLQC